MPGFGTVNVPKGDNAGAIDRLKAKGKVVICYLDTGAWESYRPDAALFPAAVIGNSSGWSGEKWLDIRVASWPQYKALIEARLDLASGPGVTVSSLTRTIRGEQARVCDHFGRPEGLVPRGGPDGTRPRPERGAEERDRDHGRGHDRRVDGNLNEECNMYSECDVLSGFIKAGKAVFQVEYTDEGMTYDKTCPPNNTRNFDGLLKTLDLDTWRQPCR